MIPAGGIRMCSQCHRVHSVATRYFGAVSLSTSGIVHVSRAVFPPHIAAARNIDLFSSPPAFLTKLTVSFGTGPFTLSRACVSFHAASPAILPPVPRYAPGEAQAARAALRGGPKSFLRRFQLRAFLAARSTLSFQSLGFFVQRANSGPLRLRVAAGVLRECARLGVEQVHQSTFAGAFGSAVAYWSASDSSFLRS